MINCGLAWGTGLDSVMKSVSDKLTATAQGGAAHTAPCFTFYSLCAAVDRDCSACGGAVVAAAHATDAATLMTRRARSTS
eukprot:6185186-Pleurochrysis_carterae.AAC.2